MPVLNTPGFNLQPSAEQVPLSTNYITDFNFLNQYLPDTYEKEFERYGNRTVASFLRLVGAEMPSNSDLIKWAEQGRLHTKYVNCATNAGTGSDTATITVSDALNPSSGPGSGSIAIRVGQTVHISNNADLASNKGIVTSVDLVNKTFDVAYYEGSGQNFPADVMGMDTVLTVFIYGSEFKKGTSGMEGSLEANDEIFENSPIIIKDKYAVSGSDMAQIGWVEITTENGASGYLWYMKSEHETRLRFEDYLETSMIEAVPAELNSGVAALKNVDTPVGSKGSEGIFYVVNNRGNVWGGANPQTLTDFDSIISRLDKQGAIEENVIFLDRNFSFDIDDMLATLNGYAGSGAASGASFGLFDNDVDMALNLGFSGFRRGYDFYKTDWKYLNDPTLRGGLTSMGQSKISGLLVPAGSTTVYDQILGKNAKRPFLHVRYRASEAEDRRYKTWITGSAGGANNSSLDAMEVHFLSERAVCTLGANNFFLFGQ
jgi:hypothetical protein